MASSIEALTTFGRGSVAVALPVTSKGKWTRMRPYEIAPGPPPAEAVLEAAVEVRRTAWLAASGHASLDAVIDGLSDVFPYDEILLSRWNPDTQEHVNVISSTAASTADFIQFEQHRDPLVAHMRRTRQSLWLSKLTAEQRRVSTTVQKVITPLGFAEGTTQCLYSTEGHYVGVLNIGTRSPASTLGPARHALTLLFDVLASTLTTHTPELCTPTGRTRGWEATIADDTNFCTVSAYESTSCADTAAAFPLAQITRDAVRTRRLPTTLIVPFQAQCIEVHLRRSPVGIHASCQVVDFDGPLSLRELQVLAELARGHTNQVIAQILTISPRTVATHIEHTLTKLGVPNRAAAAAYGARLGLDLAPPPVVAPIPNPVNPSNRIAELSH